MMEPGFDIQIAHGVEEVGQAIWDSFGQDRPFASYRWYRFLEAVMADNRPFYLLIWRRGEPVARATFWLMRQEHLPVSSRVMHQVLNACIRRWPLLTCRSPVANEPGLILPDPPLRDEVLKVMAQTAAEIGRQNGVSFILFDYLDEAEATAPCWPDGFSTFQFTKAETRLTVSWPNFESYLGSLGQSTRRNYRQHGKHAEELGIRVEEQAEVTDLDQVIALIGNVEHHHGVFPDPFARRILENMHLVDSVWLPAYIGDRLVGSCVVLGDGRAKTIKLPGLDYTTEYVYFQLMYASIRHAIETGTGYLRGDPGGYELERRLGFELEQRNYLVFTVRNRILRALTRRVSIS